METLSKNNSRQSFMGFLCVFVSAIMVEQGYADHPGNANRHSHHSFYDPPATTRSDISVKVGGDQGGSEHVRVETSSADRGSSTAGFDRPDHSYSNGKVLKSTPKIFGETHAESVVLSLWRSELRRLSILKESAIRARLNLLSVANERELQKDSLGLLMQELAASESYESKLERVCEENDKSLQRFIELMGRESPPSAIEALPGISDYGQAKGVLFAISGIHIIEKKGTVCHSLNFQEISEKNLALRERVRDGQKLINDKIDATKRVDEELQKLEEEIVISDGLLGN